MYLRCNHFQEFGECTTSSSDTSSIKFILERDEMFLLGLYMLQIKFCSRNTLIYLRSRNLILVCKPILYFGDFTM